MSAERHVGVALGTAAGEGRAWRRLAAVVPSIGASLLPVGVCPACWPAYAGVLGALGGGFLLDAAYLLPLTACFFAFALFSLGWRASTRRGYGPLAVGALGSALAVTGKFGMASASLLSFGIVTLFGAAVWNSWPRRAVTTGSCAACAPQGQVGHDRVHETEVVR